MKVMNVTEPGLYFIALIPNMELREEIKAIKETMRDRYGAGHALRSPAHITLQKPFKRDLIAVRAMSDSLYHFTQAEKPFTVELDGYGAFAPRVLFIKLRNDRDVTLLHRRLKLLLIDSLDFTPDEIMKDVQPHITIATRDLTKEAFNEAWPEIRYQPFSRSFVACSIFLLKHNGRCWDILREFPFKGDE